MLAWPQIGPSRANLEFLIRIKHLHFAPDSCDTVTEANRVDHAVLAVRQDRFDSSLQCAEAGAFPFALNGDVIEVHNNDEGCFHDPNRHEPL
jgi:hypothetical protein